MTSEDIANRLRQLDEIEGLLDGTITADDLSPSDENTFEEDESWVLLLFSLLARLELPTEGIEEYSELYHPSLTANELN